MPPERSNREFYDANKLGRADMVPGKLYFGGLELFEERPALAAADQSPAEPLASTQRSSLTWLSGLIGLAAVGGLLVLRFPKRAAVVCLCGGVLIGVSTSFVAVGHSDEKIPTLRVLVERLRDPVIAERTAEQITKLGEEAVPPLIKQSQSRDLVKRGWSIVCLGRIGGDDAIEHLKRIHSSKSTPALVKTWAAAAMIKAARSDVELENLAGLAYGNPSLSRPVVIAFRQNLKDKEGGVSVESLLAIGRRLPVVRPTIVGELSSEEAEPYLLTHLSRLRGKELLTLVRDYPALGKLIAPEYCRRVADEQGLGELESQLQAASQSSVIAKHVSNMLYSAGPDPLVSMMLQAKLVETRRQAAGLLAGLAQSLDEATDIAASVNRALKFDQSAKAPPWDGGALFLPGIQWKGEPARELVGNLIRWYLWAAEKDDATALAQLENNLRTANLTSAVGYQLPPGFTASDWLETWKQVVGRTELKRLLAEQGLEEKYSASAK